MTAAELPFTGFSSLMRETMLPFWSTEGFATGRDMFCERLDFSGRPVDEVPHRAMVQARQIFVFSHAARLGVFPEGAEPAMRALHTLLRRFCDDGDLRNGVCFSISPSGETVSAARDSYTHAFILFALASAHRLTGETMLRHAIDQTVAFVDRSLTDAGQFGLYDRQPAPSRLKSQNPLMHLLEAYLSLHEALPEGPFLDRAAAIVEHFRTRLFQDGPGAILEHYDSDWSALRHEPEGQFFEPGHQFEWAWLLHWYGTLSGTDQAGLTDRLWQTACDHGLDRNGLCFDEVDIQLAPRKRSYRLWPHTEALKAAVIRHEAGDAQARNVAMAMTGALDTHFLNRPFPAGWVDRVDADRQALVDFVPASSLYHLYSAFSELQRSGAASESSGT
ncbi:AGE family epimerase/isomerase [Inquilinus sp. CA228]|uniref:AGE family epimerase/isomerase n=1 Tax=Inquilinus sp. CA228 TaxID=3455609 RepID=UPI003F8D258D